MVFPYKYIRNVEIVFFKHFYLVRIDCLCFCSDSIFVHCYFLPMLYLFSNFKGCFFILDIFEASGIKVEASKNYISKNSFLFVNISSHPFTDC